MSLMARAGKRPYLYPPQACPGCPECPSPGQRPRDISIEGKDQGYISTRQIQRLLDEAAENAGLQETRMGNVRRRKRITPHLLRHSFSRWSLDAGIDVSYLQHQLGHSSLTTTAIYLQARPNHRRKAYEKAGFDKLLSPH